mmetsp:Transcript_4355/g.9080  ORF Transcript_4355/g.9080 Transcript_4355/m.9080 type:complete len:101 (+) Transcript_4355:217-519(+)
MTITTTMKKKKKVIPPTISLQHYLPSAPPPSGTDKMKIHKTSTTPILTYPATTLSSPANSTSPTPANTKTATPATPTPLPDLAITTEWSLPSANAASPNI